MLNDKKTTKQHYETTITKTNYLNKTKQNKQTKRKQNNNKLILYKETNKK